MADVDETVPVQGGGVTKKRALRPTLHSVQQSRRLQLKIAVVKLLRRFNETDHKNYTMSDRALNAFVDLAEHFGARTARALGLMMDPCIAKTTVINDQIIQTALYLAALGGQRTSDSARIVLLESRKAAQQYKKEAKKSQVTQKLPSSTKKSSAPKPADADSPAASPNASSSSSEE